MKVNTMTKTQIKGIYKDFHFWQGTGNKILVSDESIKHLLQFNSLDDAINHYYTNKEQDFARFLNRFK